MGSGYSYKCKKCGKEFGIYLGVGMAFPGIYRETVKDIQKGKYGKEHQQSISSEPYVAVNAENALYKCSHCGNWKVEPVLNLYVPKDLQVVRNHDEYKPEDLFVMPYELYEDYRLIKQYIHRCPKCNQRMRKAAQESDFELIKCPGCGTLVQQDLEKRILWD